MQSKLNEQIWSTQSSAFIWESIRTPDMCRAAAGCATFSVLGRYHGDCQVRAGGGTCSVLSMRLATGAHRNSSHATGGGFGFTSLSTWQQPVWFTAHYNLEVWVNSRW